MIHQVRDRIETLRIHLDENKGLWRKSANRKMIDVSIDALSIAHDLLGNLLLEEVTEESDLWEEEEEEPLDTGWE